MAVYIRPPFAGLSMADSGPFRALPARSNFLGLEARHSRFQDSKIAVLPAPYEHTVSYGSGTSRGPAAIVRASHFVEFYDEELDRELCFEMGIVTLPRVAFGRRTNRSALQLLERLVDQLLERKKWVMTLGGEHTISFAPIAAHLHRYPDLSVLQLDAHSDVRDSYQGTIYSHACVMARVCEILEPSRLVQVGIRAQSIDEARFIRERGVRTFYAHQIRSGDHPEWQDRVLASLSDHVYVSVDVDGLDPSIMPSTGTPEPNGLFWAETLRLLRRVGEQKQIVGCDIVELAPVRGVVHPDLTAAKLAYKLMNFAFPRHGSS
jgi:agmatinase